MCSSIGWVIETIEAAGRRMKVYDLSQRLGNHTSQFEPNRHEIEYVDADQSAALTGSLFGIGPEFWPDGKGYCVETVRLSTHAGTHVDAPHHYGPARRGTARTIDQVPLRWCLGDGVRLDMRRLGRGQGITRTDVELELERVGHRIKPYDIVLIWTGTSQHFETPGYDNMHPGLRRDATEYLVDQGVRLIGIDAWGLDRPFDVMVAEAKAGDAAQLWESHVLGREKEYSQIEKLCNLELLPKPSGFTVIALPVKLDRASAGWARVVAVFEESGPD
jgi:kynurenine formamidase